jgi:hypothetical protein
LPVCKGYEWEVCWRINQVIPRQSNLNEGYMKPAKQVPLQFAHIPIDLDGIH